MFRPLTRIKQQLTNQECIDLLINEKRGVLSVIGDNDYPYGMPMNHYYDIENNVLYRRLNNNKEDICNYIIDNYKEV